MKILLIATVLGCALISSATGSTVADADESSLQLGKTPQNPPNEQDPIAAEPLNEATSPQLQKILSTIPELIQTAAELKSTELIDRENSSAEIIVPPQDVAVQSNRGARQLIGFIPTYMLRQAIRFGQIYEDDDFYNTDDDIEEERAIRRRKRIVRRNNRGHVNKPKRQKNTNKRNQMKRRKVNMKRKSQKPGNFQRKRKMPRKKNKRMKNKNKPNRFY